MLIDIAPQFGCRTIGNLIGSFDFPYIGPTLALLSNSILVFSKTLLLAPIMNSVPLAATLRATNNLTEGRRDCKAGGRAEWK